MGEEIPEEKRKALNSVYTEIFLKPFAEKYEETWEEEPFWEAVEVFKVKTKEIGLENPFDILGKHNICSYETIRDRLKAGPQKCTRKNWTSPIVGEKIDVLRLLEKLHHISGNKYKGKEDIVVLEFWATWCGPCIEHAAELSELSDRHMGRVAVIGINNDKLTVDIDKHGPGKHDVERVRAFVEERKNIFRYMSYIDNDENLARLSMMRKSEYTFYPCVVLVVGGTIIYAGHRSWLNVHLEEALK
ncbi:hypothetical protein EMPS_03968 [Entomortierella parvispora]|uniref:Thioredoxin domain-containing protein n=1 Tax=Entomortierella parvispora TaxID=205924 RepID=A0A9P3LV14_9FUNG|nr:hypothetical protein EMPS_03968 [Entomortierella parvispora]